jgi:hypothetical protein
MSAPAFSILHATYGRPEKAVAAMRMWWERAARPEAMEYVFACNTGDDASICAVTKEAKQLGCIHLIHAPFSGSAPAWDAAAKVSTGQILIQGQDDVEPPQDWDHMLIGEYEDGRKYLGRRLPEIPAFIAVSDGYRKDRLCCTAIMNRARYKQQGEFLHAGYKSVYSDDEVTVRAYADAAEGKCVLIEARDIVFLHQNPYHTGAPHDATLLRENSPEAYELGGRLFMQRNADLVARGFKTW